MNTAGAFGGGIPGYNGPTAAGMTGNEGDLIKQLMSMQGQGGGVSGTNDYLSKVMGGNFLPGQPGGNPFLSGAITAAQRTTMDNLTDTLSRSLPGYFTANGQMISPNNKGEGGSSAFDMAAATASRGAATAMGDIAATMGSNAFGQERQLQQQAVPLSQQEIGQTIQTLQAASLPRMIQELGIERGMSLYQTNITGLLQLLSTMGNLAGPVVANASTGQSTQQGQGTSSSSSSGSGSGSQESATGVLNSISNLLGSLSGGGGKGGGQAAAAGA